MKQRHAVFAVSTALALVAVFELALNGLDAREAQSATRDLADRAPVDVRVVVNEGSGDVTLARRR